MQRVPPPLSSLLETDLDSYEKLEVLRALRGAGTPLARAQLAGTLGCDDSALDDTIDALTRAGFLVGGELLRLGARATGALFGELMDLYEREQASVLSVLSRFALRRIRERAARALVERRAWRDDDEGD